MPDKNKIFRIPEHISIKIAAGEVIENPSSVVKELVENSIDAKSDKIDVEITGGGKKSIKITDNGIGMSGGDALLSIERFTTSKLNFSRNLLEDIDTLGFRGEALASIASVSHFNLTTKTKGEETATSIYAEGGKVLERHQKAAPFGTSIEVKNLFFNFPARRKFLKQDRTEKARIESAFERLALPYEGIGFSLSCEGRKIFSFEKGEPLAQRIKKIFPQSAAPTLLFSNTAGEYSVSGIITAQGVDFPTSANILIYVNGRTVRDKVITHAVCEALRTHIASGRYPGGALFLNTPRGGTDVNVHPAKAEIKFLDPGFVHNFVQKSLEAGLLEDIPVIGNKMLDTPKNDPFMPFSNLTPRTKFFNTTSYGDKTYGSIPMETRVVGYFSNLKILGQLKNSYIICGDEMGVVIIDQHAAHERVTFENLREDFNKRGIPSQNLLFPIQFDLAPQRADLLKNRLIEFLSYGFSIEEFGENSFMIRSVPEILIDTDHVKTISDILEMMSEFESSAERDKIRDEILKTLACHSSVRFSKPLAPEEMRALLIGLDGLKGARTCPHGRPFMVSLDEFSLKKMFKRA